MVKIMIASAGVLMAASALATSTMQGNFKWVNGTLGSSITITGKPQTVQIKVGTVTDTFTNTYVTGPIGGPIPSGANMRFLEVGSSPFVGSFTGNRNILVGGTYGGFSDPTTRRTIPMTAAGALSYSVASELSPSGVGGMAFAVPQCTVGSLNFQNGLAFVIGTPVASYSLPVATAGSTTLSTVTFPGQTDIPNSVSFVGYGNGMVHFEGRSMSAACEVAGNTIGTPTTIATAILLITSGADIVFFGAPPPRR